jgi:uncharacterized DUF497 family protein
VKSSELRLDEMGDENKHGRNPRNRGVEFTSVEHLELHDVGHVFVLPSIWRWTNDADRGVSRPVVFQVRVGDARRAA